MKKLVKILAFAALAASFAACNKEQDNNAPVQRPDGAAVLRVTIPEQLTKVSFTDQTAEKKGVALAWQAGDALRVISGEVSEEYTIQEGFSAHDAEFAGNPVEGESFTIIYPASIASEEAFLAQKYTGQTQTGNGNTDHLVYNACLSGVDASSSLAITSEWATAHGGTLLQNGILKLALKLPEGVTTVKKAALVAPSAIFYTDNAGSSTASELAVNLADVDVSASSQVLTAYMNIPAAGVTLPAGTKLSILVTASDGLVYDKEFNVPKETVLQGGQLNTIRLTTQGVEFLEDYFVTPAGAGEKTGENWENALGTTELAQVLGDAFKNAPEFDGTTFYMAEGEYYLAENAGGNSVEVGFEDALDQISLNVLGGYPAGLTGVTTAGRDTTQYRTALSGGTQKGILTLGHNVKALFEGLTFKDVSTDTDQYGALAIKAAGGAVTLKSCRFVNNVNTNTGMSGAGVILDGGALTVENCYFSGNLARNAGALLLRAGDDPVSVTDCLFSGNRGYNTSGAAQNAGLKDVTFTRCQFVGNQAYDESINSWGGGAFHTGGSAETTFVGCTFENNAAKRCGGAISLETATVTCTDCTFTGNRADQGDTTLSGQDNTAKTSQVAGGAIILRKAGDVLTLNNCTFIGNSAPNGNGGAIGTQDPAATLTINAGTTFQENTALFHGGAIFSWGGFTIVGTSGSKVTFTDNKTLATGNQYANGGCIWLNEKTTSTISYAVFSGSAAGQPDGGTVNYSNGGAISMKGVTSFLADNCEFTGNIGRNGGCLNLELGGSSVCKFTNCNFHDNHLEEGTSGNFHGGAARISYGTAQFEKCVFTNNSAYNGSGVFHINANKSARIECKDCEFEGNYCGNGRGGCVTVEYGSLYVENCNFKENHAKTDRGGVFYVDSNGVSLEAKNCTFTGNYIDGSSCFGAVMRTQDNCEAIYTDCVFDGNYSTNRGGIFGLNGKTRLKMNRCVVKNNHAASGGMIQGGADVISYLNRVTFVDNYTTGSGGWGVAFHNGNNNACLNNCTLYGNHCTNSNPGNNISLNSDGGWLIVNSTVVDDNVSAIIRANGSRKVTLCNNILINRKTADNMFMLKSAGLLNDLGHNVMSYTAAPASPAIASSSLIGATDASLGGSYSEVWNAANKYGVYSWTNNLTGFSPAAQADVENAMKTGYPEKDGTHTSITNIGLDFYNWLVEIGEIATDGRGVARTGSWWPGAYQN